MKKLFTAALILLGAVAVKAAPVVAAAAAKGCCPLCK